MSIFTMWYAAGDEAVDVLMDGAGDFEATHLGGIGELELYALGEVLGALYEPELVREGDSAVLRVNAAFLGALAAVTDVPATVEAWRARAEYLADMDEGELTETLGDMQRCARDGLAGPGVVSFPSG